MDGTRFDRVTAALSSGATRRAVCRAASVGVVGAALGRLGLGEVAAACGRVRKRCRGSDECCGDLKCGRPTTRHTCSSTVGNTRRWCCIKAGDPCRGECDCCGGYECSFGDNPRVGRCTRIQ